MESEEPRVRAGYMRMMFQHIDRIEHPAVSYLHADLAGIRAEVESASVLGWLPGDLNFDTCDAMLQHLGFSASDDFFASFYPHVWRSSRFMAAFVRACVTIHQKPAGYARYMIRGYPQIFQGWGTWEVDSSEDNQTLATLREAPARTFDHEGAWLRLAATSIATVYEIGGHEGTGEVVEMSPPTREARFRFTWD